MSDDDTPAPDPRRWAALLFIGIAQLMVYLDGAIMNIALPSAQQAAVLYDAARAVTGQLAPVTARAPRGRGFPVVSRRGGP
ncbi:hypothetical protein OG539_39150 [Actinacidiphila glaucinigra]|uniref:hypothetical protein n=1 Tax=Actinacidiphila glaucinigra TaxID=235986 RepID=UPI00324EED93